MHKHYHVAVTGLNFIEHEKSNKYSITLQCQTTAIAS